MHRTPIPVLPLMCAETDIHQTESQTESVPTLEAGGGERSTWWTDSPSGGLSNPPDKYSCYGYRVVMVMFSLQTKTTTIKVSLTILSLKPVSDRILVQLQVHIELHSGPIKTYSL